MSYSDFREVSVNDPGTVAFYGADDILEVMQVFNNKIVTNRRVRVKNPWQFTDNFDIVAAAVTPGNPGANTKRIYVEPSNNHLIVKSSGGTTVDIDVLGQGAVGEVNTASNFGTAGVGVWKDKSAADLRFKKINGGSTKITVTDDTANSEVDIDVAEANLTHNNIGGILGVTKGGTGVATIASNGLIRGNGTSAVNVISPGTNGHILTMVAGAPAWAAAGASADVKTAIFENSIQVGSVGRRLNFLVDDDFTIAEDSGNDRFNLSLIRAEYLVGSWTTNSGMTKTNIGTSYVDLFSGPSDGNGCDVDGMGRNDVRLYLSWSKNFGSGTHSVQVKSQSTADVLITVPDVGTGRTIATGTIPAYFANQLRSVKLQAKSTVSTDDPIFYGAQLYYK